MSLIVQRKEKQALLATLSLGVSIVLMPMGIAWADAPLRRLSAILQEENQVLVNGQSVPGAWTSWSDSQSGQSMVGVSDGVWMRHLGGDFADSLNPAQQGVKWYSQTPAVLTTRHSSITRYLNISEFARQRGWQLQTKGNVLEIRTPSATVQSVQLGQQPWGRRLVLTLDQPAPWRMPSLTNSRTGKTDRKFKLQVDAQLKPETVKALSVTAGLGLKTLKIKPESNQISIEGEIEGSFKPQVSTLNNPPRLVIDIRQIPMSARRILWAPGIEWHEDIVSLGSENFPVTWLTVNPRQPGLTVQPFMSVGNGIVGIKSLANMAQENRMVAAINAGFFSRDRKTPLGAIRRNGTWMSSPILNRGIIAWNPQGQFKVGRLMLQEWLASGQGQSLSIVSSNSGYPQKGIARYTPLWGPTYTPLLKNEQIVVVSNNQVQSIQPGTDGVAVPIPSDGFLLAVRAVPVGPELAPGTSLQYQARSLSPEFEAFPNIVGAGPLLIENGRVVVNATAEQFSPKFVNESADRSGIGQTATGTVLLAATHNRIGGAGPSLEEWASIMQRLGALNALNLDGGSSTALYLGGQLLDRHPSTAARVHNGIGVFLQTAP
jgi:hypothetical protein